MRWGSPRTPEGGQARKRWWEVVGTIGAVEIMEIMGMVGGVGIMGAVGAVGGVKRGKLCQSLGTLTKFIIFF